MKKIIILVLFSISIFAQNTGAYKGGGIVFADTLKTYGSGVSSDSAFTINLELFYGFPTITVKDTGASIVDTLKIYKGAVTYVDGINHTIVDTVWTGKALSVRNNAWTSDTLIVGSGNYVLLDDNIQLLKIVRVNTVVTQSNKTRVVVEAKKN